MDQTNVQFYPEFRHFLKVGCRLHLYSSNHLNKSLTILADLYYSLLLTNPNQ
jgi:hypothetical protein